jgi:hypothetical protein
MRVRIEWRDQDGCLYEATKTIEPGEEIVVSTLVLAHIEGMRTETVASEISFRVIE